MPSVLPQVFHVSLTNLWHNNNNNNINGTLSSAFELAGMTPASFYAGVDVQCTRPMLLNCAVILLSCEVWMSSKVKVRSNVKVQRVARWLDLVSGDTSHWWRWVSCFSLQHLNVDTVINLRLASHSLLYKVWKSRFFAIILVKKVNQRTTKSIIIYLQKKYCY